jgi:hypothetical protein
MKIKVMTCKNFRRRLSPAVCTLSIIAAALVALALPETGRAQPPPITNTVVTTVITTSVGATNTVVTTNVTTKVDIIPPPVAWSSAATFGLTVTGGNSQTLTTTLDFNTSRKTPENELLFDVNGTYGETSSRAPASTTISPRNTSITASSWTASMTASPALTTG